MAAKKKKTTSKKSKSKRVLITDLAEEFGIDGRRIRQVIRGLGFKAPKNEDVGDDEFGARTKYSFAEGSGDLKKIRDALAEAKKNLEENPPKPRKRKSKAKAEEEDVEEEEEDTEEDEDEDYDDDDDEDEEEAA